MSLNIPGFPKENSDSHLFFTQVLSELKDHLIAHRIKINDQEGIRGQDAAGDYFIVPYMTIESELLSIKKICELFETSHPLGRFIDVDLNGPSGDTVSSGKSKLCFFCLERPAIECRRENTHEPEELRTFMFKQMASYTREKKARSLTRQLSGAALDAILLEISLSPKPGLVDKFSNGSHKDMDYNTFLRSSVAISLYFEQLIQLGWSYDDSDLTCALPEIRKIGLQMERVMFEATGGVNTQKGIIFLMGLSLFACGKIFAEQDQFDKEKFRFLISSICNNIIYNELSKNVNFGLTHGEITYGNFGFGGARAEAESGFKTVFEYGLPQIEKENSLTDELLIRCLLSIAAVNNDTNILFRGNPGILKEFQQLCKKAYEDFSPDHYAAVIEYCKTKNISPGGSADLLVVTIFVWILEHVALGSRHGVGGQGDRSQENGREKGTGNKGMSLENKQL